MTTPAPEALTLKTSTSEELEDWPVIATLFVNVLALAKEPLGSISDDAAEEEAEKLGAIV